MLMQNLYLNKPAGTFNTVCLYLVTQSRSDWRTWCQLFGWWTRWTASPFCKPAPTAQHRRRQQQSFRRENKFMSKSKKGHSMRGEYEEYSTGYMQVLPSGYTTSASSTLRHERQKNISVSLWYSYTWVFCCTFIKELNYCHSVWREWISILNSSCDTKPLHGKVQGLE